MAGQGSVSMQASLALISVPGVLDEVQRDIRGGAGRDGAGREGGREGGGDSASAPIGSIAHGVHADAAVGRQSVLDEEQQDVSGEGDGYTGNMASADADGDRNLSGDELSNTDPNTDPSLACAPGGERVGGMEAGRGGGGGGGDAQGTEERHVMNAVAYDATYERSRQLMASSMQRADEVEVRGSQLLLVSAANDVQVKKNYIFDLSKNTYGVENILTCVSPRRIRCRNRDL
jgi:hypothetical protein